MQGTIQWRNMKYIWHIWLALAFLVSFALTATSEVNIDYSHNVKGTGTVMTDYQMGDKQGTEASGKVRGTGDVMDKYLFQASNSSANVTIENEFVMFKKPANTDRLTIDSFPQMSDIPDFRLTGAVWAGNISLPVPGSDRLRSMQTAGLEELDFMAVGNTTNVTSPSAPEINESLIFGGGQGSDRQLDQLNMSQSL